MELNKAAHSQFLFLYAIALADFKVHPSEISFLKNFGLERGITEQEIEHILMNPVQFNQDVPDSIEERIASLYHLAEMIWADGEVAIEERHMLERICETFGFIKDNIHEMAEFLLERAKNKVDVDAVVKEAIS